MEINKVVYNGDTLLDLTSDTVTPQTLLSGATAHAANGQSISGTVDLNGKADKVANATAGNFAGLDSSGNLTDSGKSASDFDNVWLGTRAEHTAAVTAGTLPATAIIGIEDEYGNVVQSDWSQADSTADDYIKNKPTALPASNTTSVYSSTGTDPVNGIAVSTALQGKVDKNGTDRLMTANEGTKLSGIATGATANTVIDTTVTLSTSNWSGSSAPYSATKTVSGVLATDKAICDLSVSSTVSTGLDQIDDWALISRIVSGNGTLTFYCYEDKPTVDLTVNVKVVR